MGWKLCHVYILDADFLVEEGNFLIGPDPVPPSAASGDEDCRLTNRACSALPSKVPIQRF
jgi:hypothetical protein